MLIILPTILSSRFHENFGSKGLTKFLKLLYLIIILLMWSVMIGMINELISY